MDRPETIFAVFAGLVLLFVVIFAGPRVIARMRQGPPTVSSESAPGPGEVDGKLQVLENRRNWKKLSPAFLTMLASKFAAGAELGRFADLCETTKCLDKVIVRWHDGAEYDNGDFCFGSIATYLSSYGNAIGDSGRLVEARMAFMFALEIYPRHVPTWVSMCMAEQLLGNYKESIRWADSIESYAPDPKSESKWEQSMAGLSDPKEQQRVGKALGLPAEDVLKEMKEQARAIKAECLRRLK